MDATPKIVVAAADVVGESIVYDDRRNALLWVDICGKRVHRLHLGDGRHEIWPTPDFPTSVGLRRDGGIILGLRKRIVLWDYGDRFEPFADIEADLPRNRLNEGCVAPDGSFWVGTMQDNLTDAGEPREMTASTGALWRVAPDASVTRMTPARYGIANTLAWTRDGRLLSADTLSNTIEQFTWAAAGLGDPRPFATGPDRGLPDGSTRLSLELSGCWRLVPRPLRARRIAPRPRRAAVLLPDELHVRRPRPGDAVRDVRPLRA